MSKIALDIVGLGNALLDIQVKASDEFLKTLKVDKASMQLVDAARQAEVLKQLLEKKYNLETSSGGCAANTLAGLASFGGKAELIAKLGSDSHGYAYIDDLKKVGISYQGKTHENLPTGTCLALITPDAERTMLTHLGAAQSLSAEDVEEESIERAQITYLEGYLWDSPTARDACLKASEIAKAKKRSIALTLSDSHCVNRHFEDFESFVRNSVDILFSNESEALAITKKRNVHEAFQVLKKICKNVFISVGPKGALLSSDYGKNTDSIGTWDVNLVDKLGAGDLFASGVLFGLTRNKSLRECGYLGCYAATRVIQQMSARIEDELKNFLDEALKGPGPHATECISLSA